MEFVSPGVYMDDGRRTLHLDIPALLEFYGKPDTPKNRELLARSAEQVFRKKWPRSRLDTIEVHL